MQRCLGKSNSTSKSSFHCFAVSVKSTVHRRRPLPAGDHLPVKSIGFALDEVVFLFLNGTALHVPFGCGHPKGIFAHSSFCFSVMGDSGPNSPFIKFSFKLPL